MDAQTYNAALAELRAVRDKIKKSRAELAKLETDRNQRITRLAAYSKAKAERLAPAAGMSVADIVALAPELAPDDLAAPGQASEPATPPEAAAAVTDARPAGPPQATAPAINEAQRTPPTPRPSAEPADDPAKPPTDTPRSPAVPSRRGGGRRMVHPHLILASTRPNFTQQARSTVFLDTTTGDLVHRQRTHHLDLAGRTAADILTAVFHAVPDGVERIYITAGDPWHRDADRYPYLRDAVTAWLNAPTPGWRTDTGRGRDRMAGHFVHARNPVGRYQRDDGKAHVEIRSVGEWFDLDDHDTPATVRDAFVLLWQALRPTGATPS
ncbi:MULTISPECIES: hypothetical protein [Streptomyces]|uniref:hypothetical protein n=1 Tax=Streptomyces sp. CC71 TaxID=1770211 RepID=UPI000A98F009|nr:MULTISPECIES: hypothetical protein [Streptomyces]